MKSSIAHFEKCCRRLMKVYRSYDAPSQAMKLGLLKELASCEQFQPRALRHYHEILLFLEAFPDSEMLYRLATAEISRLASLIPSLVTKNRHFEKELLESGICGSRVHVQPGLVAMKWLLSKYPTDLVPDFDHGIDEDELDEFLGDATSLPLSDAVMYAHASTKNLLRNLSGGPTKYSARWLNSILSLSADNSVLSEHAYKRLRFWLYWRLNNECSRTSLRLRARRPFIHRDGLLKHFGIAQLIKKELPDPLQLSESEKRNILDVARAILYQQRRETDSINYGSTSDLHLFKLDRGIDVVLIGTELSRRRYVDSFYGFIAAKNSIPCAYGGAWMLGSKADIGVNVFDTFRGGESVHIFAQIMRCYHNYFGVDLFEVEPYQFGEDNEEGMQSGAFWFYWKMGFRSISNKLNSLAQSEIKELSSEKHKISEATLKRLCGEKLQLLIGEEVASSMSIQELGFLVCNKIGGAYAGDIEFASKAAADNLARKLKLDLSPWSEAERHALIQLSLPLSILLKPAKLKPAERVDLVALIKAKAASSERDYCMLWKRCAHLFQ